MAHNFGTNLFAGNSGVQVGLTDANGNAVLARSTVAAIPTGAGYAIGCLLQATDTGNNYVNTGTASAATFTLLDSTAASLALPTAATDSTTTTGSSLALTQNTVTTGNGLLQTLNGLTTGKGTSITHTTAVIANGGALLHVSSTSVDTGTTTGNLLNLSSTGSTAGTQALLTASALTTGIAASLVTAALTTGTILKLGATAATLTTGRYLSANDGATEVFGVGLNGHLISTVSANPPTIAVTTQAGITAAAITAGGSDTCGVITTTGTSTGATVLDVTFGKTYTTAPKTVTLNPANSAAAMPNTGYYVSAISATGFTITVAAGGTYAATPSWRYFVIA